MFTTEIQESVNTLLLDMNLDYNNMEINSHVDVENLKYQLMTANGKWNDIKKVIRKPDDQAC